MKHEFEKAEPNNPMHAMQVYGSRKCKNCGKVQHKYSEQNWGRIIGYKWLPLIGRCKPIQK